MDAQETGKWAWLSGAVQSAAVPALLALIGIMLTFWHQVGISFSEIAAKTAALEKADQALSDGLAKTALAASELMQKIEVMKAEDADLRRHLVAVNQALRDRISTCGRDTARLEAKLDGLKSTLEYHSQMHHKQKE